MNNRALIIVLAALAAALSALWLTSGSPTLDRSPQAEAAAIKQIADRALGEMEKRYPPGDKELVRRDAHAKAHGCARGLFVVDPNLASDLRLATFSQPGATFRAWVRFSNGAFEPGSDASPDGRGMAMKLIGADNGGDHDFLTIDYPQFFSPDAFDYLAFAEAGALTFDKGGLLRYFAPNANPFNWRIRQAAIAYRTANQKIDSPLSATYYSMVPFRFGADKAVKYALKPCQEAQAGAASRDKTPDYLRRALVEGLAGGPACFVLLAQFRTGDISADDATADWPLDKSPFRKLGELTLPIQKVDAAKRDEFCEAMRFTPWNAPAEMAPLGSINQARKAAYDAISDFRHRRNGVPVPDPAKAWDAEGSL